MSALAAMSDLAQRGRAHRRIGLVLALWGVHVSLAYALAAPLAALIRNVYRAHPEGDAVLFADGGMALLDFLMRELPHSATAISAHALIVLPLAFFVHTLALGTSIAKLAFEPPPSVVTAGSFGRMVDRAGFAIRRGAAALIPLVLQSLVIMVLQALALALASWALVSVSESMASRTGAPTADRLAVIAAFPFVLVVIFLNVVRDLAAVSTVAREARGVRAFFGSFPLAWRAPKFTLDYGWRTALGWTAVLVSALVSTRFGGKAGGPLFVVLLAHQLALVTRISLRVSWLAAALRRLS